MKDSTYGSTNKDDRERFVDMEMPSPNSTENASAENLANADETYRLLGAAEGNGNHYQNGNGAAEIQLHKLRGDLSSQDDLEMGSTHLHRHCRRIALGAAAFLGCTFLALWWWSQETDRPFLPFPDSHSNNKATTASRRPPFSTLDPVKDLGLYDFARPESSTPSKPMTEGLAHVRSYPTNAWYQNLLMVRDVPQPIHRSYSIPYVVDAAGPVPGVRIHPNHIDASSLVVQLNVIDEYGLTLGVASMEDSSSSSSSSSSKRAPPKLETTYKVTQTTPLGVTLTWVRLVFWSFLLRYCIRYTLLNHMYA
jgi:hypothetical protein